MDMASMVVQHGADTLQLQEVPITPLHNLSSADLQSGFLVPIQRKKAAWKTTVWGKGKLVAGATTEGLN